MFNFTGKLMDQANPSATTKNQPLILPHVKLPEITPVVTVVKVINEHSFPSGHAMHYTNFYGLLIYLLATNWRSGRYRNSFIGICTSLIAFIGPSRNLFGGPLAQRCSRRLYLWWPLV